MRLALAARLGVALVMIIGAILVGRSGDVSARSVALDDGSAWLVSSIGQAALVDGVSAQVVTQVEVPPAGTGKVAATQFGADAYVSNTTDGTVRRLDGATFEVSGGAPFGRPGQPLAVYAGPRAVFAVSEQSGTVTMADPRTLRPLPGQGQKSLAARIPASGAAVDGAGRLWMIDSDTRRTVRLDTAGRHDIPGVIDPARAIMVLAGEQVAVVDPGQGTVRLVGDGGLSPPLACVDTPADDDTVRAAGSVSAGRVHVASGRRGVLLVADLSNTSCHSILINLEAAGHELGVPQGVAGRVFVPDFTAGRVLVVDVAAQRLVTSVAVLPERTEFELVGQGSFVFYNDPASERAGVVHLDGSVTQIRKYNPDNHGEGVDHGSGSGDGAGTTSPPSPPGPPSTTPSPTPPRTASISTMTPPPTQPTDQPQSSTGEVRIALSADRVAVGQPVAMRVIATGDAVVAATWWTFSDGGNATGVRVQRSWSRPGVYTVRAQVFLADNRQAIPTAQVTVVAKSNPPVTPTSPPPPPTPPDPVARLTVKLVKDAAPLTITADASGSSAGSSEITRYSFDFGDGQTRSGRRPKWTYAYTKAVERTVTLTVTNSAGRAATATATVDLSWPPPDCISYDPKKVTMKDLAPDLFQISDGGSLILTYRDKDDAQDGLALAQAYSQHCFVGRHTDLEYGMDYWLPAKGSPVIRPRASCTSHDKENLVPASDGATDWVIRNGAEEVYLFADERDAQDAILVMKHYDQHCTVGWRYLGPDRYQYYTNWFRNIP
jgi:hypothetical protein